MFKKSVGILVCFLVILGFGIADCYGKTTKKCQKTETSAADANATKTCPIKALFKKCGLDKDKKACPKDCKKACCAKKVADANTADPNSKNTCMKSMMKKCGLDKKACCKKKCSADCKKTCSADCKKACCKKKCSVDQKKACHAKKAADANCPNTPAAK
jgi:hypothetical protein